MHTHSFGSRWMLRGGLLVGLLVSFVWAGCLIGDSHPCERDEHCSSRFQCWRGWCVPRWWAEERLSFVEKLGESAFQEMSVDARDGSALPDAPSPESTTDVSRPDIGDLCKASECVLGTVCPCYPSGQSGCEADGSGCKGICNAGQRICSLQAGKPVWSECLGAVTPQKEICNGKDDDCNGKIDDGFSSEREICNGKDDDCNGKIDDLSRSVTFLTTGHWMIDSFSLRDGYGNIYIAGIFFDEFSIDGKIYRSRGGTDVFVVKLSSLLSIEWVIRIGGSGDELVKALTIAGDGDVYVSGIFDASTNDLVFNSSNGEQKSVVAKMDKKLFLVRISTQGKILEPIMIDQATMADSESFAYSLTLDHEKNVYMAGLFNGQITLANVSLSAQKNNDTEPYLAKFSFDLQKTFWIKQLNSNVDLIVDQLISDNQTPAKLYTVMFERNESTQILVGEIDYQSTVPSLKWLASLGDKGSKMGGWVRGVWVEQDMLFLGGFFSGEIILNGKKYAAKLNKNSMFVTRFNVKKRACDWITVSDPAGASSSLNGFSSVVNGVSRADGGAVAITGAFSEQSFRLGAWTLSTDSPALFVSFLDPETGQFLKSFQTKSPNQKSQRGWGIFPIKGTNQFDLVGFSEDNVQLGSRTINMGRNGFFLTTVDGNGGWDCK